MPDGNTPNRLAQEQSPYLLQHAHNPVDWYPWGNEAFARARAENKPVFVSIGYAACHWCHVMERESFEDHDVAEFLNKHYISIKVDREERPDVDALCMDVCQSLTGHGGWPLTIMMDAGRRPFFAGTYFPKFSRGNRLGFLDLLKRIRGVWDEDHQRVIETAAEITRVLQEHADSDLRTGIANDVFEMAEEYHRRMFDNEYGGFSVQPKFPSAHHLLFLLRREHTTQDPGLLSMVCATLDAMRSGGLYDHVGGGFHRYSTDREWLLPHFEKMLYDQAMLIMAYTEAWQRTRDPLYRNTVIEVANFVDRELTVADGRFAAAQDADSEGEEGKFYVWSAEELSDCPADLLHLLNVRAEGNFSDEATGNPLPQNILHVNTANIRELERRPDWHQLRVQLRQQRRARVPPLTDDKVLTDWNGLMIGALARAARALQLPYLQQQAERAFAQFSCPPAWHRSRNGNNAVTAMLDDTAMLGWAAGELYQTTGNIEYLASAVQCADHLLTAFANKDGVLYTTPEETLADVPVRQKNGYDGAYPCGNSMAALLFATLAAIMNSATYRQAANRCVTSYGQLIASGPAGFCMLLCAWDQLQHGISEIVVHGNPESPFIKDALAHISANYQPRSVIVYPTTSAQYAYLLAEGGYGDIPDSGDSIAVCTNNVCELPLTDINAVVSRFPAPTL